MAWWQVLNSIVSVLELVFIILIIKEIIGLVTSIGKAGTKGVKTEGGIIDDATNKWKDWKDKRKAKKDMRFQEELEDQKKAFEMNRALGQLASNESQRIVRLQENANGLNQLIQSPNFPDGFDDAKNPQGLTHIKQHLVDIMEADAKELEKEYNNMIKVNRELLKQHRKVKEKIKRDFQDNKDLINADEKEKKAISKKEELEAEKVKKKELGSDKATKDLKTAEEIKVGINDDEKKLRVEEERLAKLMKELDLAMKDEKTLDSIDKNIIPLIKTIIKDIESMSKSFFNLTRIKDMNARGRSIGELHRDVPHAQQKLQELKLEHDKILLLYNKLNQEQIIINREFLDNAEKQKRRQIMYENNPLQ